MRILSLRNAILGICLSLGLSAFSLHQAVAATTIKLAHPNVPSHPMGMAFEKFKELVEERSDGDLVVEIYDSGKFGDDADITQGIQIGTLQMGSSSTPNLVPFSDAFLLFDMPFLFTDYESTDRVADGEIGQELAKSLEESGIIGLGYIDIGFRHLFNSKRPVGVLEDAAGLKVRSTASKAHIDTLKSLGMNPTPITWSEVYTALQQKTVDGVSIDLNLAYHNKFQETTDYLTIVGETYSPHLVMIGKGFFENLDDAQKKIITSAFKEAQAYERELIRENEKEIIQELKEQGMDVTVIEGEELEKFREAVQPVYEQYEDRIGMDTLTQARELIAND